MIPTTMDPTIYFIIASIGLVLVFPLGCLAYALFVVWRHERDRAEEEGME